MDDVSFKIREGETLGLVGESGSGKTTVARVVAGLMDPDAGDIFFEGSRVPRLHEKGWKEMRRHIQMVFQDPYSYLNPRHTVRDIVSEPLIVNKAVAKKDIDKQVRRLLESVGLKEEHMKRYPHQFSGGQRQRIAIARALALTPKFIVLDEVTSALDVSVQAQVLYLLKDLQEEFGLSYLFVSHDLAVVQYLSDNVSVMYAGKLAETTGCEELFTNTLHPYTKALIAAVPKLEETPTERLVLGGDMPSPVNPPSGCRFHPRCPYIMDKCRTIEPQLIDRGNDHLVACHLYG